MRQSLFMALSKIILPVMLPAMLTVMMVACGDRHPVLTPEINDQNVVLASEKPLGRVIGDDHLRFRVWSNGADDLTVELPPEMLNSPIIFGGVVIAVSDHKSLDVGGLKLVRSSLIHGQLKTQVEPSGEFMLLEGCAGNCSETGIQQDFFHLPLTRDEHGMARVSFAGAANNLKISSLSGNFTELMSATSTGSKVTRIDYSHSTLVIDTEETLKNLDTEQTFSLTIRWFAQIHATTDPWFISRTNTAGVGFFTTDTNAVHNWITRWSLGNGNMEQGSFHYFLKNVPTEWQSVFAETLIRWNELFTEQFGRKILDYTILQPDDPRNHLIQAGDVRFNVIEWDIQDLADYGGLGPSIALQTTGQTINANVLVQGPTIIKKYKAWFGIRDAVSRAREDKNLDLADHLILQARRAMPTSRAKNKLIMTGGGLSWNIPSSDPQLHDPIGEPRDDFAMIPDGESFETYMHGYFLELLGHEVGHNLGLRHNFKGNIFAEGDNPSASIMEYLGRPYRYKNFISHHDIAAIKYGYTGEQPLHTDQFCTDEDVLTPEKSESSPECLFDDATKDPYSMLLIQLDQAIDYLINRGRPTKPEWTIEDVDGPLSSSLFGLCGYAARGEVQASSWASWTRDSGRPVDQTKISAFVLNDLKSHICAEKILNAAASKGTPDAKAQTRKNVQDLINRGQQMLETFKLPAVLNCSI